MSNVDYSKWDQLDVDDEEPGAGPNLDALGFDPSNPPPLTISTGEHAISLAKQGGDKKMEATLSRLVCQKYLDGGDVKRSRELISSSMRLARELGDKQLEEDCDVLLGQILQVEGDVDGAMQLFAKAAVCFKSRGDPGGEAAQRINLGKCYEMKALMREAMAEFKYALEVAKRTQPPNKMLLQLSSECIQSCQELTVQLAQMQQKVHAVEGHAPTTSSGSFLSRAKEEGWGADEDSDSDEDITGSARIGDATTLQADMQELNSAMSDAARMIVALRQQGRLREADSLEVLINQEMDTDDDSSTSSDVVDCDDLE